MFNCSTTKVNDIALLELVPDPSMQSRSADHVSKPIKLAPKDMDPGANRDECIVSGWGHLQSRCEL